MMAKGAGKMGGGSEGLVPCPLRISKKRKLPPARLGFWGLDPRVKPEDDSARGTSWGQTGAV